ncbi:conserved hypothetical protein [Ricinus communis]|uniref:Uncharacterized protein n=1 Tax=Ricinus communis TaxID=3988 RepID=B9SKD7_RICCO|nr:conserved hypothetical protein [Ricinus communis]
MIRKDVLQPNNSTYLMSTHNMTRVPLQLITYNCPSASTPNIFFTHVLFISQLDPSYAMVVMVIALAVLPTAVKTATLILMLTVLDFRQSNQKVKSRSNITVIGIL